MYSAPSFVGTFKRMPHIQWGSTTSVKYTPSQEQGINRELWPADEESPRKPASGHSARGIIMKSGRFVMAHIIMDHRVPGCFGTSLAPFMARLGHIDHALPFGGDSFICSYSISRRSGSRTIDVSPEKENLRAQGTMRWLFVRTFDLPLHDDSHFAMTGSGIADEW